MSPHAKGVASGICEMQIEQDYYAIKHAQSTIVIVNIILNDILVLV